MKKIAIAVAAALTATAASAANFNLYGVVDTGFGYTNKDTLLDGTTNTFEMINGYTAGSRFGLKGTEDLGNGYSVSFILENGFASDTGVLGQSGRMFGREANLKVHSPYGTLSFGRAGTLLSGASSLEIFGTYADALPGGWDGIFNVANYQGNGMRLDNMVTYQTPTAAGFTGYAQYSFANDTKNGDSDNVDNMRKTNRYTAFGLTYANGPVNAVVIYDTTMFKHYGPHNHNPDKSLDVGDNRNITVGGSYDFGFMRVSAYGQYVKGARSAYGKDIWGFDLSEAGIADGMPFYGDADGYNFGLGTQVPLSWGRVYVAAYYGALEVNDTAQDVDIQNFNILLGTEYDFSKRTSLYSGIAYRQVKADSDVKDYVNDKTTQVIVGLRHAF